MKKLLAIDPGASGGLAWVDEDGIVQAVAMPEGMTAQVDILRSFAAAGWFREHTAIVEKVGTYHKGNAVGGAVKFARHCGHLEAALYALGIPFTEVAPAVWMKRLGTLPSDKPERKRAIREDMARRYPHLTVTLRTADALGILATHEYGRHDHGAVYAYRGATGHSGR